MGENHLTRPPAKDGNGGAFRCSFSVFTTFHSTKGCNPTTCFYPVLFFNHFYRWYVRASFSRAGFLSTGSLAPFVGRTPRQAAVGGSCVVSIASAAHRAAVERQRLTELSRRSARRRAVLCSSSLICRWWTSSTAALVGRMKGVRGALYPSGVPTASGGL